MYNILLLFTFLIFGLYNHESKAQIFTKPSILICDKSDEIQSYLETEGYVKIVSGITETVNENFVYNAIYGTKESILFVTHFSEGYSCFVSEINNIDDYGFGLEGLPDTSVPKKES